MFVSAILKWMKKNMCAHCIEFVDFNIHNTVYYRISTVSVRWNRYNFVICLVFKSIFIG